MDDATLVAAARSGDDTAWAAIYDRYADKLHDHCFRILRDRDEAADALHDAFLAASRNLHQLREPDRLRPWLYSICRHLCLRRLKARSKLDLTDSVDDLMATEPDLDRGVRAEELSELVWAAAAGLSGRDQALLDLQLRQGLEGQDLADAMGTSLNSSYVMVSRMRDQVERSLGALLVARLGREDCAELDALLAGWDGRFTPLLRKRVARHVDGCEICSERRRTVASPLALLALAPLVPAPSLLKARVISSVRNVEVVDAPHVPFTKDGFAALGPADDGSRPRAAWLLGIAAVLLLAGGLFLGTRHTGSDAVQTASGPTTVAPGVRTRSTDSPSTSTPVSADAGDSSSTTTLDGATGTTVPGTAAGAKGAGSPTTATTGKKPSSTTTTAKPRDTAPPVLSNARLSSLGCAGTSRQSVVSVKVTDASPVTVVLVGGPGGTLTDSNHDGTYTKTFDSGGGTPPLSITATDSAGNSASTPVQGGATSPCSTTTTSASTTTTSTRPS